MSYLEDGTPIWHAARESFWSLEKPVLTTAQVAEYCGTSLREAIAAMVDMPDMFECWDDTKPIAKRKWELTEGHAHPY